MMHRNMRGFAAIERAKRFPVPKRAAQIGRLQLFTGRPIHCLGCRSAQFSFNGNQISNIIFVSGGRWSPFVSGSSTLIPTATPSPFYVLLQK
jgi:hypothetical protein